MKIYKNEFNTLPMQVEENMKNIELLASIIKESYRSDIQLLTTDVSIAISDTNASADTTEGWLIDPIGKIFKITGGDGTNLLIEFFTDIRGPQGPEGTTAIDDNVISLLKTWSSDKISNEILGLIDDNNTLNNKVWSSYKISQVISYVKDKGVFATDTQPSIDGGGSYYTDEDILNSSSPNPPRYSDLIIYIDGNGKVKYLYQVTGVSGDGIRYYVTQIAEFSQGKQFYRHCLRVVGKDYSSNNLYFNFEIINNSDDPIDTSSKLINYLYDNGYWKNAPFSNPLPCINGIGQNSYDSSILFTIFTREAKDVLICNSTSGEQYIASNINVYDANPIEI